MRILISLFFIMFLLTGCGDPTLTDQDNMFLREIKNLRVREGTDESSIEYRLLRGNPVRLAEQSAQKGDHRLISLAMGYHATEKDASVFGVKCTAPIETQSVVFGCVPPPPVIFKLMQRYNAALIRQPGFPGRETCKVDEAVVADIEKMEKDWDDTLKKDAERAREKWAEKERKSRAYND